MKHKLDTGELLRQGFGIALLARQAAHRGGLHLLDDGAIGRRGFNRQLLGQQKIAAIAFGDLHHVTAGAKLGYIFFENDFHAQNSVHGLGLKPSSHVPSLKGLDSILLTQR